MAGFLVRGDDGAALRASEHALGPPRGAVLLARVPGRVRVNLREEVVHGSGHRAFKNYYIHMSLDYLAVSGRSDAVNNELVKNIQIISVKNADVLFPCWKTGTKTHTERFRNDWFSFRSLR